MIKILLSVPPKILTMVTDYRNRHVLWIGVFSDRASQVVLVVKNSPANAGDVRDVGSIPGWGRYPRGGHGNPLQYSCLENPLNRGAWQATIHRFAESDMTEATEHALLVTGKQSPSQGLRFIYKFSCSSCATLTPLILVCMRTKKP